MKHRKTPPCRAFLTCHLHGNHLVTSSVTQVLDPRLIADMFCMAKLLRGASYFQRLQVVPFKITKQRFLRNAALPDVVEVSEANRTHATTRK